nr:hypothetical protein [Candidatus Njordarchaeota archaeon]
MARLACEFCGTKTRVRACAFCGAIVCDECAAQVLSNKVLCRDCASSGETEAEELEETEELLE